MNPQNLKEIKNEGKKHEKQKKLNKQIKEKNKTSVEINDFYKENNSHTHCSEVGK